MPTTYNDGPLTVFNTATEIVTDLSAFAASAYVPETPLMSMLPRSGVGSTIFTWNEFKVRPTSYTVGTGGINSSVTSLPIADASMFMAGDILRCESEDMEVTADPSAAQIASSPNTLTVRRGIAGTSGASHTAAVAMTLVSNSRTGAEVNSQAVRNIPTLITNYTQTVEHPVQIGGSLAASYNIVLPTDTGGTVMSDAKLQALRNMKREFERALLIGRADAASSTNTRPKMNGARYLITTNLVTAPTNASAYKPSDFIRDTTSAIRSNGGNPTVAFVSSGFSAGLAKWGMNVMRIQAGTDVFGTPISMFEVPFLGPIKFMEHQQLGSATNQVCLMLTEERAKLRMKRNEFWNQHGIRGDANEGDWIAEGALQLVNEFEHAWVEGITGFAAE